MYLYSHKWINNDVHSDETTLHIQQSKCMALLTTTQINRVCVCGWNRARERLGQGEWKGRRVKKQEIECSSDEVCVCVCASQVCVFLGRTPLLSVVIKAERASESDEDMTGCLCLALAAGWLGWMDVGLLSIGQTMALSRSRLPNF